MKIKLKDIAHARSGDKGDAGNVGVIAYSDKEYEIIKKFSNFFFYVFGSLFLLGHLGPFLTLISTQIPQF
ncbi:MAG: hypothetical protein IH840_15095 [Candidatus Heimdallarchaeota archaeon]|nr:hypothetical protein [Candidatus Heimdallarchaeota archaeon]